jgi:hypothetical protein
MPMEHANLHMWAASSGWDGPFQHEEVIVLSTDLDGARRAAEIAFADVTQPVCRAKMRIADLGPVREGAATPPRRHGELFAAGGASTALRCDPAPEPHSPPG